MLNFQLNRWMVNVFLVIVFATMIFLISNLYLNIIEQKEIKRQYSRLPNFEFFGLDNKKFDLGNVKLTGKGVCIIYFHTTCEHCQFQADQIRNHIKYFANVEIFMVSVESPLQLIKFAKQYGLSFTNLTLLHDPNYEFSRWFGRASVPTTFIYDKHRQLKKVFRGAIKIDAILKEI